MFQFCHRGILVVTVSARRGMSDRTGWREAVRADVFPRLSCLTSPCASLVFWGFSLFCQMFDCVCSGFVFEGFPVRYG
jgi:hypothetical protein